MWFVLIFQSIMKERQQTNNQIHYFILSSLHFTHFLQEEDKVLFTYKVVEAAEPTAYNQAYRCRDRSMHGKVRLLCFRLKEQSEGCSDSILVVKEGSETNWVGLLILESCHFTISSHMLSDIIWPTLFK